jgi:hypothetical protein
VPFNIGSYSGLSRLDHIEQYLAYKLTSGEGAIPNNVGFTGRNAADTADVEIFRVTTGNAVMFSNAGGAVTTQFNGPVALQWSVALSDGVNVAIGTTNGTQFGATTAQKLAFHGSTAVIQRAGAAQAAAAATASTQTTPWGYSTQAQADAVVTLVNEIRATLVEKGLMKGAA